MKILLYKPNADTAFRKFENPCEVSIPKGNNEVRIIDSNKIDQNNNPIILGKYKLIKKYDPVWTDNTKMYTEIMVKIIVEEIK